MRQLLQHEFESAPIAEYEVDPKDCYVAVKYMGKKFYGSKARTVFWKRFLIYMLIGALLIFAYDQLESAGVVAESDDGSFLAGAVVAVAAIGAVFLVLCFWIIPARALKRLQTAMQRERHSVWRGDYGLAFETASKTVFFDYKGIDEVAALARGMIICSGMLGYYIPDSAFESDNKRKEFLVSLKSRLGDQALSASSVLTRIEV